MRAAPRAASSRPRRPAFANPYVQNVLSEFIAIAILVVVGVGVFWATRRRALVQFFGIGEKRRIVVYLSRLEISAGASTGVDGRPRSFSAAAVPEYEANLIPFIRGLFGGIRPGGDTLPGVLGRLVYDDITVDFRAAPAAKSDLDHATTFIAIGSAGYNAASGWIEKTRREGATLDPDTGLVHVRGLGVVGDASTGVVERIRHTPTGQVVFYVAGPSMLATSGAVHFLLERWKYLRRRFADDHDFCVLLAFPTGDPRSPEIISERRL